MYRKVELLMFLGHFIMEIYQCFIWCLFIKKVPPIDQKRIVAFINHFVIKTAEFLNKFAVNCETKLIAFESKLHKVEASLAILEAKVINCLLN